jgi:DNA-directed RNA polymerase subunit RPC12/RpoP
MNEQEAREIVAKGAPSPSITPHSYNRYTFAEGYLAGLEAGRKEEMDRGEPWVCRSCHRAFRPSSIPHKLSCIVCPDCGGDRMPKPQAELLDAKEALLAADRMADVLQFVIGDARPHSVGGSIALDDYRAARAKCASGESAREKTK